MTAPEPPPTPEQPPTADLAYAERLHDVGSVWWKRILPVQLPYRLHLRSMKLGRTLDVGCGYGRNLQVLPAGSVGVDHNPYLVQQARAAGLDVRHTENFFSHEHLAELGTFDSMLVAHVVEHLTGPQAREVLRPYLPLIEPGGRVVFITPQERGYASDHTHVLFSDLPVLKTLADDLGLEVDKQYSFPFPRSLGKAFPYNEFVQLSRTPR